MRKISGILFDFNGTLFFDSAMHAEAFNLSCDFYGIDRFSKDYLIRNVFGRTNMQIFRERFKPDATEEECARFSEVKKKFYYDVCLSMPERLTLARGAEEMLSYLKEKEIPYALATGSERDEVDFFMKHLRLDRWFSYDTNVIYTDGTFRGKPEPDCYILAARRIGLAPSECAVFEDGRSGILAAHAAGCGAVIAVHEQGIPSPTGDGCEADAALNDHSDWKNTLSLLGFEKGR